MVNEELIKELGRVGLSEKEASVYLASLELGPAPVQDISHKGKVNRATTYVMIDSLMGRGLMSSFVRGKKRFYAPESPDRLRAVLKSQRLEVERKEGELETVFPMLAALYNAEGAKPQIRYLEGVEGVATVRELFQKMEGEIVQFSPFDPDATAADELQPGRDQHVRNIFSKPTSYRAIVAMERTDLSLLPRLPNLEVRVIPRAQFPTDAEITIRGNTVCLYSFKSAVLAIVITSKEIADGLRTIFELAWMGAEKYPSQKT